MVICTQYSIVNCMVECITTHRSFADKALQHMYVRTVAGFGRSKLDGCGSDRKVEKVGGNTRAWDCTEKCVQKKRRRKEKKSPTHNALDCMPSAAINLLDFILLPISHHSAQLQPTSALHEGRAEQESPLSVGVRFYVRHCVLVPRLFRQLISEAAQMQSLCPAMQCDRLGLDSDLPLCLTRLACLAPELESRL